MPGGVDGADGAEWDGAEWDTLDGDGDGANKWMRRQLTRKTLQIYDEQIGRISKYDSWKIIVDFVSKYTIMSLL